MKTTTLPSTNSLNRSPLRTFLLPLFVLACFVLLPQARATCQDGCLTNDNTVLGDDALLSNTGSYNTALGFHALFSNTTGYDNTATGVEALFSNTMGYDNTANGLGALSSNTTGFENTAIGLVALGANTTGSENTATGYQTLNANTTGIQNTATGALALYLNTTGYFNTAIGFQALGSNTTGFFNTATGNTALVYNTTGDGNTATGEEALFNNTTGNYNTASGQNALHKNTSGSFNVGLGPYAGYNLTTGNSNIALGYLAGLNLRGPASNNIDIGNAGAANESNKIRIGTNGTHTNTFIAGISGATVPTGIAVIVDTGGHLGTTTSSVRFKEAIKPMDKASEAILALKPVIFRYKQELDPDGIPQFGLVAEQVEKVNPDLVARDEQGKPYSVRYEAVNAMLLNEFLKEHRKVEEQGAMIARQQKQIEALTAGLQKVSAQLELSKPATRTALNNQ